jgi:hypothetical protein
MDQLDALVIQHVVPEALRINREPRLNSRALHEPAIEEDLVFIPSGQPWRNGVMASLTAASGPNVSVSYIFLASRPFERHLRGLEEVLQHNQTAFFTWYLASTD